MAALTNRLEDCISPYLREHAPNPVAWQPWDEHALEAARESDRPILLSIGYSACHWCHVMAHESFSDPLTAEVMNREFVNIKVDREERPGRLVFAVPPDSDMTLPEAPAGGVVARRCRGTVCDAPETDPDTIARLLTD